MAASHYKLGNLTAFVDRNRMCIDGVVEEVMAIEPLKDKWESFGWNTLVTDGHDFKKLAEAIEASHESKDKPTMIIANTSKGKGVDFMEDDPAWHYCGLDPDMLEKKH